MKVKRVNRYYCDFCKKSGCRKDAIEQHEKYCTLNPNRGCRMCEAGASGGSAPLPDLMALLPDPNKYRCHTAFGSDGYDGELTTAANAALRAVRDLAENCPACILAAIRQRGIPVPMVEDFNYSDECKSFWQDVNGEAYPPNLGSDY